MDLKALTEKMNDFVREKGWYEPGSPKPQQAKNLAISIAVEAGELLELFQWEEAPKDSGALASELADVMLYLLQLASVSEIDLETAVLDKLEENHHRSW